MRVFPHKRPLSILLSLVLCGILLTSMGLPVAHADEPSVEAFEEAAIKAGEVYQQANDELTALEEKIQKNNDKLNELNTRLPQAKQSSAKAIRRSYKIMKSRNQLIELILSMDDFNSFLGMLTYINNSNAANTGKINELGQIHAQLTATRKQLATQKAQLDDKIKKAQTALEAAQKAAQAARQKALERAAEARAKWEAEQKALQEQKAAQSASVAKQNPSSKAESLGKNASAQTSQISQEGGWKKVVASHYGINDGFLWGTTASGDIVTPTSMGVAMKTVPLGTVIEISYKGYTVRAVVNDRGPFVAGREIDMQPAVAYALGFENVGVGAVYYRIVS